VLPQKASFNSPVRFNVGVAEQRGYGWYYDRTSDAIRKVNKDETRPQCSACFINSVDDSMESILELAKTEGMLFKYGSGTGSNLSRIRDPRDRPTSGRGRGCSRSRPRLCQPVSGAHQPVRRLRFEHESQATETGLRVQLAGAISGYWMKWPISGRIVAIPQRHTPCNTRPVYDRFSPLTPNEYRVFLIFLFVGMTICYT